MSVFTIVVIVAAEYDRGAYDVEEESTRLAP
jgi:hypothetical protein